jgi:hypothetical protein
VLDGGKAPRRPAGASETPLICFVAAAEHDRRGGLLLLRVLLIKLSSGSVFKHLPSLSTSAANRGRNVFFFVRELFDSSNTKLSCALSRISPIRPASPQRVLPECLPSTMQYWGRPMDCAVIIS